MRWIPGIILVLAVAGCAPKLRPDVANLSGLNNAQKATVSAWLEKTSNFRPAGDSDCNCAEDIAYFRKNGINDQAKPQPDYRPYQKIGDFNKDGQVDIAIVMFSTTASKSDLPVLLIFNGPFEDPAKPPAMTIKLELPMRYMLFFEPGRDPRLSFGIAESDVGCLLKPKGQAYVEDCDPGF